MIEDPFTKRGVPDESAVVYHKRKSRSSAINQLHFFHAKTRSTAFSFLTGVFLLLPCFFFFYCYCFFLHINLSGKLRSPEISHQTRKGGLDQQYMGCERWLPPAPKVKKPRSIYNAASLAYIGDCIYELYARRHFLFPPLSINDFNERVMKVVRCESQDLLLKKLLAEEYLTEAERDVLRWGKNKSSNKTKTTKRVGVAIYNSASSLETLIGYLYLTDVKRLEDLMFKLGFSTDASSKDITDELRGNNLQ